MNWIAIAPCTFALSRQLCENACRSQKNWISSTAVRLIPRFRYCMHVKAENGIRLHFGMVVKGEGPRQKMADRKRNLYMYKHNHRKFLTYFTVLCFSLSSFD